MIDFHGIGILTSLVVCLGLGTKASIPWKQSLAIWGICSTGGLITGLFAGRLTGGTSALESYFLTGFSSLGGLIGGGLVLYFWTKLSSEPRNIFWAILPVSVFAGLGIGRVGCFLDGCSFGVPAELNWLAVVYSPGTDIWLQHFGSGFVELGADQRLELHPYNLYLASLNFVLLSLGVYRFGARETVIRVGFRLSLLYLLGRFILDEFRSPLAGGAEIWLGMNVHQLFALALFVGLTRIYRKHSISTGE